MFFTLPTLGPASGVSVLNPFHPLNYRKLVSLIQLESHAGGNRVLDLCGNINVTTFGNPTWNLTERGEYVLNLNGTSQYASTGTNGIPESISAASQADCTLACWINTTNTIGTRGFLGIGSSASDTPVYMITNGSSTGGDARYARFFWRPTTGSLVAVTGSTRIINDGNWHRLACTKSAAGVGNLYVDGMLEGTTSGATGTQSLDRVFYGALHRNTLANFLGGRLGQCEIWDRVLSPAELMKDYTIGLAGGRELLNPLTDDLSLLIQSNAGFKSWWGGRSGIYGGGMI